MTLEKEREVYLELSYEKRGSIAQSQGGEKYPTYSKKEAG
jgi:hypothetical protein